MVSLLYITNRNRDCMTWINNYWSIDGTNIQTGMIHPYNAHYSIIRWFTVFMILRDLYDKSFDNEYVLKRMSLRNESYGNILDVGVEEWTEKQDRKKASVFIFPITPPPPLPNFWIFICKFFSTTTEGFFVILASKGCYVAWINQNSSKYCLP